MKAKLLKKLRKKARRLYIVFEDSGRHIPLERHNISEFMNMGPLFLNDDYNRIDAIEYCNNLRRRWILYKVERLRRRLNKPAKLNII